MADTPIPATLEANNLSITPIEYYYILKRLAATLTVWNARNLNVPSALNPLDLKDLNPLYHAFDRDCCIVVSPVALYDSARTDWHALQAAHTLVYHAIMQKGWDKIELTGLDTMVSRGLVTTLVLGATPLRSNVTDKEQRIADAIRLAAPEWVKSQGPGQSLGQ